jgi:hypothetical protein
MLKKKIAEIEVEEAVSDAHEFPITPEKQIVQELPGILIAEIDQSVSNKELSAC